MAKTTIHWLSSILTNDESSTDGELVAHFKRGGLTDKAAKFYVAQRDRALREGSHFKLKRFKK